MIEARELCKSFGEGSRRSVAVDHVSFLVPEGETLVLVGPSGCGKTTTLKLINRLYEPTSGEMLIDEINLLKQDPVEVRRRIGYVMQGGGLFPHFTVERNVGAVCRLLGWDRQRISARVAELLELVDLDPATYRRRYPFQLSGGQKQRVGIARALAADPPLILCDEPFSALDPITRGQLQQELLRLKEATGKTIVFVTHDLEEAILLGDRIAIMRSGRIEQLGTIETLRDRPANEFVAEFLAGHAA